jgi:uncharacterized protein (DUF1684 family)
MRATGLFLAFLISSCGAAPPAPATSARSAWEAWRAARHEELAGPEGWLSLVGLYWLAPGESVIGSDPASAIVLPSGPARVGRVIVDDDVRFVADAAVTRDDAPITDVTMSETDAPLVVGSLRILLIVRGDRRALRVRDVESPARRTLGEIPVYDYDPSLRVRARVRSPEPGRVLSLVNVLGMQVDEPCAALLDTSIGGVAITLAATDGEGGPEDRWFVMLRDTTAAEGETYGAGRYLDVPAPDASGETWIDFNRLYTPPCGYTSLATCPLPPEENVLAIPIRAGERYVAAPASHQPN